MRLRVLLAPLVALLPVLVVSGPTASAQQGPPPGLGSPCAPGGPAANNQYPPSACGLALGRSQVRPGEALSVSGGGFRPNSAVTIVFRSAPVTLGSATTDASGAFTTTVTIPADATPGTHTIAATGVNPNGTPRELASTITVLGAETARGGTLPRTGASMAVPVGISGAALVAVGSLAVLAARRRRAA